MHYSRSSFQNKGSKYPRKPMPSVQARKKDKTCSICKAAGRSFQGHDISSFWFLSKFDEMEIAKAMQVFVTDDQSDDFHFLPPEEVQCVSIFLCLLRALSMSHNYRYRSHFLNHLAFFPSVCWNNPTIYPTFRMFS